MGIIDKLGSRRRVTTALTTLLGERELRSLCERHNLSIPGFRTGHGPVPLLARRIATACETDRRLRGAVDRRLGQIAGSRARETASNDRLSQLDTLAAAEARSLLASALADERDDVVRTAVGLVDAIESGKLRLRTARAPEAPRRREGGRDAPRRRDDRSARAAAPVTAPPPDTGALDALRKEATHLETERARLREQLNSERDALAEARRTIKQLEGRGSRSSVDARALDDARAQLRRRDEDVIELREALEAARVDMGVLIEGARALESLLEHGADVMAGEPVRPSPPRKKSTTPPARKVRIPSSDFWPARLDQLLRRLAADDVIDAVHVVGASSGRTSRVVSDVTLGVFITQFSDGEHAAQLLVTTTADSRPTHAWMRRHLSTEYFVAR